MYLVAFLAGHLVREEGVLDVLVTDIEATTIAPVSVIQFDFVSARDTLHFLNHFFPPLLLLSIALVRLRGYTYQLA